MYSLSRFIAHTSLQIQQTFTECQVLCEETKTQAGSFTERSTKGRHQAEATPKSLEGVLGHGRQVQAPTTASLGSPDTRSSRQVWTSSQRCGSRRSNSTSAGQRGRWELGIGRRGEERRDRGVRFPRNRF